MDRKNVLLICADEWPGQLLGCAGHPVVMTPTIDALATHGMRYTNYYSECPVCIPARRCMMTGLSPKTHGDRVYSDHMEMPDVISLAQSFRDAGYQAYGVGKLHVYPQRSRVGFDDVILMEEGRYEFGVVDDYQVALGRQGVVGQEFGHGMGNNVYLTRPWHLPENLHPTVWATSQMVDEIKRRDPTKPCFFFMSYQFPHPPLVPLPVFEDMYDIDEIPEPHVGDFLDNRFIFRTMMGDAAPYSHKEMLRAKRAFYAQCSLIDNQIRLLIGTLRECNMLDDTILIFTSDHGDMLFEQHMVAKRTFYEPSAKVPLIISGTGIPKEMRGTDNRLGTIADLMPTLLQLCNISIPSTVEGISLVDKETHSSIYGEIGEGERATRMVRKGKWKLIYYPVGNIIQLFDIEHDPYEEHDVAKKQEEVVDELKIILMEHFYGSDFRYVKNGLLVGLPEPGKSSKKEDFGLYNQRGLHWPPPAGYSNLGKT